MIILAFLFINVNSVFASTPDYSVTDITNKNLMNGINNGDIIFVNNEYKSDIITITEITNATAQKYDNLQWISSTKSINITPPTYTNGTSKILTDGSIYKLNYVGTYTITSIQNKSKKAEITVTQEDPNNINITTTKKPNGFNITFEPSNFLLIDEQAVKLRIDVDDDVIPGEYEVNYRITTTGKTETINKTYKVLENMNWTITNSTITNATYKTGDSEYLGFLDIQNVGNKDIELTISKEGNDTYLIGIPQPQTLYKKSNLRLNFQVQVPSIQKTGTYDLKIKIIGGNITEEIPITITIQDSLKPIIESINFSTDKIQKINDITVVATDNNDVKTVTMSYDNKNITLQKDGNKFMTQQKFDKLSRYVMTFCASDEVNNTVCMQVNKTFVKDNIVFVEDPSVTLPTKKIGKYSKIKIFNISKKIPEGVIVQLVELNTMGTKNQTPTIRIIDEDGTVKSFSEYENEIKINDMGDVYLEVRSQYVADFDGILRIILPEYAEEVEDISFKVSFKNYDIPEDFSLPWFDNRTINCNVHDTGNLETSYYKCNLEFPIDVKKEDLSFPTTAREKEKLDTDVADVEKNLDKTKAKSGVIITILIMILIGSSLITYFFIEIYPYVRIRAKIKDK